MKNYNVKMAGYVCRRVWQHVPIKAKNEAYAEAKIKAILKSDEELPGKNKGFGSGPKVSKLYWGWDMEDSDQENKICTDEVKDFEIEEIEED